MPNIDQKTSLSKKSIGEKATSKNKPVPCNFAKPERSDKCEEWTYKRKDYRQDFGSGIVINDRKGTLQRC